MTFIEISQQVLDGFVTKFHTDVHSAQAVYPTDSNDPPDFSFSTSVTFTFVVWSEISCYEVELKCEKDVCKVLYSYLWWDIDHMMNQSVCKKTGKSLRHHIDDSKIVGNTKANFGTTL